MEGDMRFRRMRVLALFVFTLVLVLFWKSSEYPSLFLVAFSILGMGSILWGSLLLFKKDFYSKWYIENARMAAQAGYGPFNPAKEREELQKPMWRYAYKNTEGICSIIFGMFLLYLVLSPLL